MGVAMSASGARPTLASGPSLREQAREFIRALIITGQVGPDQLYSVPRLAAQLEVSATPVREALLDLAREGLLEPVRNRGFRVVEPTPDELDDIFAIRVLLEVPSAEAAAEAGVSAEALAGLHELATATRELTEARDLIGFLEADRKFHVGLIATLGNKPLAELVSTLRDRVRLRRLADDSAWEHIAQSVREHFALLQCVEKRDASAAGALMRRHLERSRGIWAAQDGRTAESPGRAAG
jgi:DNA-binding GntR family transcriptional regulator